MPNVHVALRKTSTYGRDFNEQMLMYSLISEAHLYFAWCAVLSKEPNAQRTIVPRPH